MTELRDPFADQHQDAETLMFMVAFAVLLPLSVIVSARIADRISAGPNHSGFSALCASLGAALAVVLLVTRLSERFEGGGGETVLVAGAVLWCALAVAALWRAASPRPWGLLRSASGAAPILWAVAALLVLGVVVAFTTLDSISPVVLAVGLALTAAVLVAEDRVRIPAPPRSLGAALDVGGSSCSCSPSRTSSSSYSAIRPRRTRRR